MKKQPSTPKSFAVLSAVTIIEKLLSFVYQAMIAALIGANAISDAFFTSTEFFLLIDTTLVSAVVIALLNLYTKRLTDNGTEAADALLTDVIRVMFPFSVLLAGGIFAGAPLLSYVLGPGYSEEARSILVADLRYMAVITMFYTVTAICLVILRQEKRFLIVSLKSLFISVSGILFVTLSHVLSYPKSHVLCFGYVLSSFLYMATGCFSVRRHRVFRPGLPVWNDSMKSLLRMAAPVIVGTGIFNLSMMIDKIISSTIGEGSVTCLSYAYMLYYFVETLFITNLSTILLSDFNELSARGERDAMAKKIAAVCSVMVLLLIPITIISVIYSKDLVRIVFLRGSFREEDVQRVSGLLAVYAIGFVPGVISNIYMHAHYAEGKTVITMRHSLISIGVNIGSSILLARLIGLQGIAIGTVLSILTSILLYKRTMRDLLPEYKSPFTLPKLLRLALSAAVCTGLTLGLHRVLPFPLLSFVLTSLLCFAVFIGLMVLLKDPETRTALAQAADIVKAKLGKKTS